MGWPTTSVNMEHIINPVYYQDFILAGNCEFTLRSLKTGSEKMFVVQKHKIDNLYFVKNRTREMLGRLMPVPETTENVWSFVPLSKANVITKVQEKEIEIFEWLWGRVLGDLHDKRIKVINPYNRCAHCHRPLTHPESIPIGIGPDCFKKLGLTYKKLITK